MHNFWLLKPLLGGRRKGDKEKKTKSYYIDLEDWSDSAKSQKSFCVHQLVAEEAFFAVKNVPADLDRESWYLFSQERALCPSVAADSLFQSLSLSPFY